MAARPRLDAGRRWIEADDPRRQTCGRNDVVQHELLRRIGRDTPPAIEERYRSRGLRTDERIGWVLSRAAARWPDRTALVCDGRRYTYMELWRWVTRLAQQLAASGVRPGDRLLWQLPNSAEALLMVIAFKASS